MNIEMDQGISKNAVIWIKNSRDYSRGEKCEGDQMNTP